MRRAAAVHLRGRALGLNLSRAFSSRSRESVVVYLSRSFAVSLSQPVPPCFVWSRMLS
jgi:hypothetical protein